MKSFFFKLSLLKFDHFMDKTNSVFRILSDLWKLNLQGNITGHMHINFLMLNWTSFR